MKEIKFMSYYYEPSESAVAQGKSQIKRYEKLGYYKKQGGNGSYRMVKPSVAEITYELDGIISTQSVKDMIREHYGVKNVTQAKLETFYDDCVSGKITLKVKNGYLEI